MNLVAKQLGGAIVVVLRAAFRLGHDAVDDAEAQADRAQSISTPPRPVRLFRYRAR